MCEACKLLFATVVKLSYQSTIMNTELGLGSKDIEGYWTSLFSIDLIPSLTELNLGPSSLKLTIKIEREEKESGLAHPLTLFYTQIRARTHTQRRWVISNISFLSLAGVEGISTDDPSLSKYVFFPKPIFVLSWILQHFGQDDYFNNLFIIFLHQDFQNWDFIPL